MTMKEHDCPVEGPMLIEEGKPCNWCNELDDESTDAEEQVSTNNNG